VSEPPRRPSARAIALVVHAARAVWRRRGKSFALGGGLLLAVALVAAVLFLTDALRAEADRVRAGMPDIVVQRLIAGRPTVVSTADIVKLGAIPSVRTVTPRIWGYLFVPALQGNVTIVGARTGEPTLSTVGGGLASGRDLAPGTHEMVAGAALARFLGLVLGDQLGLPSPNPEAAPLALVGTFDASVGLYTSDVVLTSEADARALLGVPQGEATDLAVSVINPYETHVVAKTISTRLPGARVIEKDLLGRVYALAYGRRSGIVLAASIPALLALLILAWDRASGLGPEEKHEVAILKAIGWSTADILWVKLAESALVSLSAAVLGLALAYGWVFVLGAPGLRPTLAGWSVLYPDSPITPAVDTGQILGMLLAVVAPFVALSIVPAWKAATLDPMEAMRS
jgi:ABC-type lipoprotein release transport system permease subunit